MSLWVSLPVHRPAKATQDESCYVPTSSIDVTPGYCLDLLTDVKFTPKDGAVEVSWSPTRSGLVTSCSDDRKDWRPVLCPFVLYEVQSTTDLVSGTSGSCRSEDGANTCTVTGLANGSSYRFSIVSVLKNGTRYATKPEGPATPCCGVPDPVSTVTVEVGAGFADVSWAAPANWGGSSSLDYTAKATSGTECSTQALTCRLEGLDGGAEFTVAVTARNSAGASAPTESAPIKIPFSKPGVIELGQVRYLGADRARVSWKPPLLTGGLPIDRYTVRTSPGGLTCNAESDSSCVVNGLEPGKPYAFTVQAVNRLGAGSRSVPIVAGRVKGPGSSPSNVEAALSGSSAEVSWRKPSMLSTRQVIGYSVQASSGRLFCATRKTRCTIPNLQPGVEYTFAVRAISSSGLSDATTSNAVIRPAPQASAPSTTPKPQQEIS